MSGPATGSSVLDGIVARTRSRVEAEKAARPIDLLVREAEAAGPVRPFAAALARADRVNVIAEHKRRSPSKGAIREDLSPADVARAFEEGGAAAVSVLTDEPHFGGTLAHLVEARGATSLPVLRKDFVVDPWQVWEARASGADAVLLIVAALSDDELARLLGTARETGLDALVEVHDRAELERAAATGADIIGVNNRNLKTLEVSLETALDLAGRIPRETVRVAESGIHTGGDVRRLREAGYSAFLVGEHLMSAPDPGAALRALIGEAG